MRAHLDKVWGLMLVGALAVIALGLQALGWGRALLWAIVLGLVLGNIVQIGGRFEAGVDFAKKPLLKLAIVLYGFRLTFAQVASLGAEMLLVNVLMVMLTFALTLWLAGRWFGIDRQTAILMGAGASICGAAAVLAADSVVKAPAHKSSVAVATVVVFGTVSMLVYPLIYVGFGDWFSLQEFGLYVGASVHEVAQVVAVGGVIAPEVADAAVVAKMVRVMLLAPFLWVLALLVRDNGALGARQSVAVPWFALGFVAMVGVNSLALLPQSWVRGLVWVDGVLLAMAMAALGVSTRLSQLKAVGLAPFKLGAVIWLWLVLGGGVLTFLVSALL